MPVRHGEHDVFEGKVGQSVACSRADGPLNAGSKASLPSSTPISCSIWIASRLQTARITDLGYRLNPDIA
ncbi:hypothetical protein [Paraburkholderia phosphatilytica]|uniref:hypothetical protein n=1 Tax=Paraburkholderia phosphatilytica TaxID=2282883 RepID=UPI000E47F790|nr:hypothetical protein [Paraburkholderia phosphatilytica]